MRFVEWLTWILIFRWRRLRSSRRLRRDNIENKTTHVDGELFMEICLLSSDHRLTVNMSIIQGGRKTTSCWQVVGKLLTHVYLCHQASLISSCGWEGITVAVGLAESNERLLVVYEQWSAHADCERIVISWAAVKRLRWVLQCCLVCCV